MKDSRNTLRSRNARLNLARKEAAKLTRLLEPELRPALGEDEKWAALFATIRDAASDVLQGVHEASAYHNVLMEEGRPSPPAFVPEVVLCTCERCGKADIPETEGAGNNDTGTWWCTDCCYDAPEPPPEEAAPRTAN